MAELPRRAGVYALILNVRAPLTVRIRRLQRVLEPGCYVYVGSARGPGGLKARVERHLRRVKKVRWHIDQVTQEAEACFVVYAEAEGRECVLVPPLEAEGFEHPVPGFGSSDCRSSCRSHLLRCSTDPKSCLTMVVLAFEMAGMRPITVKVSL